jgi:hypothetical protein
VRALVHYTVAVALLGATAALGVASIQASTPPDAPLLLTRGAWYTLIDDGRLVPLRLDGPAAPAAPSLGIGLGHVVMEP